MLEKGETLQKGVQLPSTKKLKGSLHIALGLCANSVLALLFKKLSTVLFIVICPLTARHLKLTSFKTGKLGKDWFYAFAKRNNLSLKKAALFGSARKTATANPFIVYDFYDQLDEIIKSNKLNEERIWNCDESGFASVPGLCRVVSEKGKVARHIGLLVEVGVKTQPRWLSAMLRENGPFVIFTGKNLRVNVKRRERALPGTWCWVSMPT